MFQSSGTAPEARRRFPSDACNRRFVAPHQYGQQGAPFRRPPHQQENWNRRFTPHHRDQPLPRPPPRPNFIIELLSDARRAVKEADTVAVVRKLRFQPQKLNIVASNYICGKLFYEQWSEVLETVVQLWELKLEDKEVGFWPRVVCNVETPSDKVELDDQLKALFLKKLRGLKEGDLVNQWREKANRADEINRIAKKLRKPRRLAEAETLIKERDGLIQESKLILKRLEEFTSAINCIDSYLENGGKSEAREIPVFHFSEGEIEWGRIYELIMRECRRLDDGLPIYSYRREILEQIHSEQVTVLIGETGSGKSTQLVQYLADSGVPGNDAIICTQQRKLAATALAERVKEECCGCYKDFSSIVCYQSYSRLDDFESKVIFMTDHCLLQHYMNDKQLSRISCIIVDEAHERSLNTDLLLALIKNLLCQRPNLRLVIMSATADADQLARYFFGCRTLRVAGRNFPVDIKYMPCECEESSGSKLMPSYVHDVLRTVTEINRTEKEGTILSFLTSQMEVEWACENFKGSSAVALPLHGKLSYEEQHRVFKTYPGKRKVIFATNVAETSLTIPGVKYVVDSGMVKESRFEPASGMNVLRVCWISQSSANQRAGRAGRTEPGTCYRIYRESDFTSMSPHHEPEILKVHLGVAILKILALGVDDVQDFDFVDAPSRSAIDMAIRNLVQLGAIAMKDDVFELTAEGWEMVKLGIEPRLGKIILLCSRERLSREGTVLATVMANSSSIFCRVGTLEDKLKSDCLKVQFCHPNGDLFTLLAVYKEWESVPREKKNTWCWENSINSKSMRRCQDTVLELESCLKNDLHILVPSYWRWNPQVQTNHDKKLKDIILSSLAENLAMYSGYDQLGYEVALTRKHVQLHPSCSLLNFGQRPDWVIFGDILSVSNDYLVCVTACDFECLPTLSPPPPYDFVNMESKRLQKRTLSGYGTVLLKKFCGRANSNIHLIASSIRASCGDERIGIDVNVDQNEVTVYASSHDLDSVCGTVKGELDYEKKLMLNECMEKCLYNGGPRTLPSMALFGAGAEIKHLELEKRPLTVDIFHSNIDLLDDKLLLCFLEKFTSGRICSVIKFSGHGPESEENKWGRVTFLTPDAAETAVDLKEFEFCNGLLKVVPSRNICAGDYKMMSTPSIRAKISWPRKYSKGIGIVKCNPKDVTWIVDDFSKLVIGGRLVWCEPSVKVVGSVVITGLNPELSEAEILRVLKAETDREIIDFFLFRKQDAVENPPLAACEEAILREISPFMPRRNPQVNSARVQVPPPKPGGNFIKAYITFDGSLHLEAAKALEHIDGTVLPGCQSWQKIQSQQLFHSSMSCPGSVYAVIKNELDSLVAGLRRRKGVKCELERNQNGSYRVEVSACATKVVVELRRPIETLMKGLVIRHPDITPTVLQLLFSRDGIMLMKSIGRETFTYIMFDKHSLLVRVFGPPENIDRAQQRFIKALLALHDGKQLEIQLRNGVLPPDMMKRVVQHFGPDLRGLKEKVPEAEFSCNTKRHSISIIGPKEVKQKVEKIINDLARASGLQSPKNDSDAACPICLCEVEDSYMLGECSHELCIGCLVDQCEAAIKSNDSFPLRCAKEGCGAPILLTDLRSLLPSEKLEELFRASLSAYVMGNMDTYRFCPSPDCPSVYRVSDANARQPDTLFVCGACFVETCTRCHLEYHTYLSCEKYREFKEDPDASLKEWCRGKEDVKMCPSCGFTIEKVDGCNHIECRCGKHICWVCLELFGSSDDCYGHLRSVHQAII